MVDQHDNKLTTSPSPTPLPSSTSAFILSSTLPDRSSFETAERKQLITSALPCSQVLLASSERSIPTEVRRPNQLQASNPAEPGRFEEQSHSFLLNPNATSIAKEDQISPARSRKAALDKVHALNQRPTYPPSDQFLTATTSRHESVTYSEIYSCITWERGSINTSIKNNSGC